MLTVSGKTGEPGDPSAAGAVALLRQLASGKRPDDHLLTTAAGAPLDQELAYAAVRCGGRKSRPRSRDDVLLRCGTATSAGPSSPGVPTKAVADHCGTSIAMLQRYYAKFIPSDRQKYAAMAAPKLREPIEEKVVAMRPGARHEQVRERTRLLKAFEETGDDDYRRAAECLKLPLLDELKLLSAKAKQGRGLGAAGKTSRPRLFRMHRAVMAGASRLAAARQEVADYGRGDHHSDEAAIDYLRSSYRGKAEYIADLVAASNQILDGLRAFEQHCLSVANYGAPHG